LRNTAAIRATGRAQPDSARCLDPIDAPETGRENRMVRLALLSCCAYLVVSIGRIGELVPQLAEAPLAKIAIGSALVGLFASYGERLRHPILSTRIGKLGACLLALSIISVLFSVWRSNSLVVIRDNALVLAVSYALIVKCATQWRDIEALLKALVIAAGALAIAALYGYAGGRAEARSMYDTNDLAFILVAVLPVTVGLALARSGIIRVGYLAAAATFAFTIVLTASRGGFIGLMAVAVTLRFLRPWGDARLHRGRILTTAILLATLGFVAWTFAPAENRDRIASIFSLESDYNLDPTERNGRLAIWTRNFSAGVARPIGYGVGSFGVVDTMQGGDDRAPHNTLLEAFVELGVFGALLLLRLYWVAIADLRRVGGGTSPKSEAAPPDIRSIYARCMSAALIGTLVSGFFLSMLKSSVVWALFALAAAMIASVANADKRESNRRSHHVAG